MEATLHIFLNLLLGWDGNSPSPSLPSRVTTGETHLKDVCRSGDIVLSFLTSALHGDEWPASRRSRSNPREGILGAYWIRKLGGPTVALHIMEMNRICDLCRQLNLDSSVILHVVCLLSYDLRQVWRVDSGAFGLCSGQEVILAVECNQWRALGLSSVLLLKCIFT
jgi:hypothetical protein